MCEPDEYILKEATEFMENAEVRRGVLEGCREEAMEDEAEDITHRVLQS
jgi:hypothetical protein